jgi:DNA repair protein RadC
MLHHHGEGPREKALVASVEELGDAEIVALLLGTGRATEPVGVLAARLLARAGGLVGLSRLGPMAIAEHEGVGVVKALRLRAAVEMGRRVESRRSSARPKLASSGEVFGHMAARVAGLEHEELWVVSLDGQNGARGARRVAQGGLHGCSVSSRDILRAALADAASALVLVHNHPSGDPTPSAADVAMTRAVAEAAEVVGTPLVDHVVIAGERYTSMLDLGVLG